MSNEYRDLNVGQRQALVGQGVEQAYRDADFSRFGGGSPFESGKDSSLLGRGGVNPFAGAFTQKRTPGAQYANYERAAPNVGGTLQAPQVPAGFVPPGTQPVVLPNPNAPAPTTSTKPDDAATQAEKLLADINEFRIIEGLEPFETFEDFQKDIGVFEGIGNIGMADGGIASLEPQYFEAGGLAGLMSGIGGGITSAMGGLKQGFQNFQDNTSKKEKDIDQMSREELLEYIKSGKKSSSGGAGGFNVEGIQKLFGGGGGEAAGGIASAPPMMAADGGTVQYPRMNGQIAGPGTERSDDIPAMLSDGEFVVNAKALRGIGKMDGANGSKGEQRQKGARMMYAMQQAGEQAMRNA
mgnify:CR=1 FL=1|jgi:hypothetical protein